MNNSYQNKFKKQLSKLDLSGFYRITLTADKDHFLNFKTNEHTPRCLRDSKYYAIFYNPKTKECKAIWEADWDKEGTEEFINEEVHNIPRASVDILLDYFRECTRRKESLNIFTEGDIVEIYKGEDIPVGTQKVVAGVYDYKAENGFILTKYVLFTDGTKTNANNCRLIK